MAEPVVLLPGLQSNHRSWIYQIEHFSTERKVIVPDGHHGATSIEEMAEIVIAQLPRRFHFVAWSMGGYIALNMLPRIHDRLISLVMLSTSALPEDPESTQRRLDNIALAEREGMQRANTKSMSFSCLNINELPPHVRDGIALSADELGLSAYKAQQQAIISRPDSRSNLNFVLCPTLVVVGDADLVTPPTRAEEIHARIPHSRLELISDCGHCPPLEKPDEVNAILNRWFQDAEAQRPLCLSD